MIKAFLTAQVENYQKKTDRLFIGACLGNRESIGERLANGFSFRRGLSLFFKRAFF
jgi:hypothetical protein